MTAPLIDSDLAEAERLASSLTGFDRTYFEYLPDQADDADLPCRLVAVTDDIDDPYTIAEDIESHVGEALAQHLNAAVRLGKVLPRALTELMAGLAREVHDADALRVDLAAERDAARAACTALDEYTHHTTDDRGRECCAIGGSRIRQCTCGLDAARKAAGL